MREQCRIVAVCLVLAATGLRVLNAQTPASDTAQAGTRDRVTIRIAGEKGELRGRLVRIDATSARLELDDWKTDVGSRRHILDIPLDRVARIDREEHDSLIDGAIFGALYVAACIRWWCGQGMNQAPKLPRDMFIGAALGAGLGAGIDSVLYRRTPIYPAPAPRLSLKFVVRF